MYDEWVLQSSLCKGALEKLHIKTQGDIVQPNNSVSTSSSPPLSFQFTGSGYEYFKIWIVNLSLTVITLGIYSAWAKVRRNRYFYGNTQLAGDAFEYLANPISILKGRLIAVAFFAAWSVSQHIHWAAYAALTLVFLVLLPWIMVRSLAFRARNTAFRNIRFTFRSTYGQAFLNFLLLPIVLGVFTLGLIFPYLLYRQTKWQIDNSGFGTEKFGFEARVIDYYKVFGVMLLIIFALIGAGFLVLGGFVGSLGLAAGVPGADGPNIGAGGAAAMLIGFGVAYFVSLLAYLFMFAYVKARISNIMYYGTHIDGHHFSSDLTAWGVLKVYLINILGIIFTLGLFIPWAKVNIARYMADHVFLIPNGDLNRFVADQQSAVSAVGEEVGEMFDLDIGL